MPLLYTLARNWVWPAVTVRCQTHPHEASERIQDYLGDTVLHWAAFGRAPLETVRTLLEVNPKLATIPNANGLLPLHVACSYRATSAVIKTILQAYPEAANSLSYKGSCPLICLCDYGGSSSYYLGMDIMNHHHDHRWVLHRSYDSVACIRAILETTHGMKSVTTVDPLYQRRPLYILNSRKNSADEHRNTESIRSMRMQQRAIRNDIQKLHSQEQRRQRLLIPIAATATTTTNNDDAWPEKVHLLELQLAVLEHDIRQYQFTEFWQKVSLLLVAEYQILQQQTFPEHGMGARMPRCMLQPVSDNDEDYQNDAAALEVLHASVGIPDCPASLQQSAILLYEHLLGKEKQHDDDDDDDTENDPSVLALHVAVSNPGASSKLVSNLIVAYPEATQRRDRNGKLPLQLALERMRNQHQHLLQCIRHSSGEEEEDDDDEDSIVRSNHDHPPPPYDDGGIWNLIEAYPIALLDEGIDLLLWGDAPSNENHRLGLLRPYLFSRLSMDALFTIFQACPTLLTIETHSCLTE
jgi:ankyrin repeat protein